MKKLVLKLVKKFVKSSVFVFLGGVPSLFSSPSSEVFWEKFWSSETIFNPWRCQPKNTDFFVGVVAIEPRKKLHEKSPKKKKNLRPLSVELMMLMGRGCKRDGVHPKPCSSLRAQPLCALKNHVEKWVRF